MDHDIQRMNDAGNITQDGQEDVDAQVGIASTLEEDTQRREEDGKNDLANVADEVLVSQERCT